MASLRNRLFGPAPKVGSPEICPYTVREEMRRVDRRQWWVWGCAIFVTLALMIGLFSFTFPFAFGKDESFYFNLKESVEGLFRSGAGV